MDWLLTDLIKDVKILQKKYRRGLEFNEEETEVLLSLAHQVREIKGEKKENSPSDLSFRRALVASLPQIIWYMTLMEEK